MNLVGPSSPSDPRGVLISLIKPGGAAAASGQLEEGDQICFVNDRDVTNLEHMAVAEALRNAVGEITLEVVKNLAGLRYYFPDRVPNPAPQQAPLQPGGL